MIATAIIVGQKQLRNKKYKYFYIHSMHLNWTFDSVAMLWLVKYTYINWVHHPHRNTFNDISHSSAQMFEKHIYEWNGLLSNYWCCAWHHLVLYIYEIKTTTITAPTATAASPSSMNSWQLFTSGTSDSNGAIFVYNSSCVINI